MRREACLDKMDGLIPWRRLEERIVPFHPQPGHGHRAYPLGVMPRERRALLFLHLGEPGMEEQLRVDAGYPGAGKREERREAEVNRQAALKAGKRRRPDKAGAQVTAESPEAAARAKARHPLPCVKRLFDYAKARYRGRNTQASAPSLGPSNLLIAGRHASTRSGADPSGAAPSLHQAFRSFTHHAGMFPRSMAPCITHGPDHPRTRRNHPCSGRPPGACVFIRHGFPRLRNLVRRPSGEKP